MEEDLKAVVPPTQIVIPPKPSSTHHLEMEADNAIAYLDRFTTSPRLEPELRLQMNEIKHTIKSLRDVVVQMREQAQANHDKLVEVVRSQRLMG